MSRVNMTIERWVTVPVGILALAVVLWPACRRPEKKAVGKALDTPVEARAAPTEVSRAVTFAGNIARYEPPTVDDASIERAVWRMLFKDQAIPSHRIRVSARKGVIILRGTVDTLRGRSRAVEVAEAVKGVRSVVNLIRVEPMRRPDPEIRRDVLRALRSDPATDSYEVEVAVKGGRVTLTGQVDSWQEKQLVPAVVEGVRGVAVVENQIDRRSVKHRPDHEIASDIRARMKHDALLDDSLIKVTVIGGRVTLTGSVGSAMEKTRAAHDAWVAGVKRVDYKKVAVQWNLLDSARRKGAPLLKDETIAGAIQRALLLDPRVQAFKIAAHAAQGTVWLSGTVDNLRAKQVAAEDARNTVGVRRVYNRIRVKPVEPLESGKVVTLVAQALARDPVLRRHKTRVGVLGGHVTLTGRVPTAFDRRLAARVTAKVHGVEKLTNAIVVSGVRSAKRDWDLAFDIADALFWHPNVDLDQVSVVVDGGVVTLSGQVRSWRERELVETVARRQGAWRVRNRLTVARDWSKGGAR